MYPTYPRSSAGTKPASIALVGAGEFGATFAAQVRRIPDLRLRLVCDRDTARSETALLRAGYQRRKQPSAPAGQRLSRRWSADRSPSWTIWR